LRIFRCMNSESLGSRILASKIIRHLIMILMTVVHLEYLKPVNYSTGSDNFLMVIYYLQLFAFTYSNPLASVIIIPADAEDYAQT